LALRPQRPQSRADQLAQRDAAQQDVFMREVDEALRQDEMVDLVKRWGVLIAAGVVVVLLALAGYLWWDNHSKQTAGEVGEQFTMALDKLEANNLSAADKELVGVIAKGGPGSVAAAKLLRGGIASQQNKPADAAKLFAEVSADAGAPKPFRDLATIREVAVRFDQIPPQQVIDRLKPLAVEGNAFFGTAGEMTAVAMIQANRGAEAGRLLAAVARDKTVPDTLRTRAARLATSLGVNVDVAPAAAPADKD
jgi:hypothetical protein